MDNLHNFTPDGSFYVMTIRKEDLLWVTAVFKSDRKTGYVDFSYCLEEFSSSSQESALALHQKTLWRWSGDAHPDDILGIGEGYY